jgi:SAM-dependent methyltransferase
MTEPRTSARALHQADPTRTQKAAKILAILRDFLGPDLSRLRCLDVGCSGGEITQALAPHFGWSMGADVDAPAVFRAGRRAGETSVSFTVADGSALPVASGAFDVVICAQVYEHTERQLALADEIWRVLRPGGVCFFSGPNRLAVMEEHYWLPFLSWLPQPLADGYMRLFRKGTVYDVRARFYWQIRRLWRRFEQHDYTLPLLRQPERFAFARSLGRRAWLGRMPVFMLRWLTVFVPNYNWILVKPDV